jgi:hypothetical protein
MMSTLLEATERALAYWQQWHQTKDSGLGFKKRSTVFSVQSSDFDSMCDRVENRIAVDTEVVVNGLQPIFREALRKEYGISKWWPHSATMLHRAVEDAKALLGPQLHKKGVIEV